jgi:hypothetical protein
MSPVPASANEPSREEHTRSQPAAPIARSNSSDYSTTYAQAVMSSNTPLSPTVKRTARTQPNGRDCPANAARASAAACRELAVTRSPTELRYNPADNAAAAALWTAADAAAAAAKCDDLRILQAVLLAAAATANALAQTGAQVTVQAHRRGGRPPPTRRANPRARPRRNRRPTGTPAPRATAGSRTAKQPRQHDPNRQQPPRAGQARPQPGAPPTSSRNHAATSATLATRKVPPLSPTVMRWNTVDRA